MSEKSNIAFWEIVGIEWPELLDKVGDQPRHEPLPNGQYDVVVTDVQVVRKDGVTPTFECTAKIIGDPRKVWFDIALHQSDRNAMVGFLYVLTCMGVSAKTAREHGTDYERLSDRMIGKTVRVTVREHTTEGIVHPAVRGFGFPLAV